ncbi:MAG: hypothetical protein AB1330_12455 [Bacillota bacterium]
MGHQRYSVESLGMDQPDPKGRLFFSDRGIRDLSGVSLLLASVDTVRQLYSGKLSFDLSALDGVNEWRPSDMPGVDRYDPASPLGQSWAVKRLGMASGYRYALMNRQEGLIILLGSYYRELDKEGAHLKIEVSPNFLSACGYEQVQLALDRIASFFLEKPKANGVAVHLALDVQGWEPGSDFLDRFVTRARAIKDFQGIQSVEFDLASVAAVYGDGETLMFGRASSLQAAIYRKDKEIVVSDKADFFASRWGDAWDQEAPVWRIEMRFHHNVVREIGQGMDQDLLTYAQVVPFLHDLWTYALTSHRLTQSKRLVDAAWQLFRDDADFSIPRTGIWIKRKKKETVASIGRNLAGALGNMITLWARTALPEKVIRHQLRSMFFYKELRQFYECRGWSEYDLFDHIGKQVRLRRLTHKVAA